MRYINLRLTYLMFLRVLVPAHPGCTERAVKWLIVIAINRQIHIALGHYVRG